MKEDTVLLELTKDEFNQCKVAIESEFKRFRKYVYNPESREPFDSWFMSILEKMHKVETRFQQEKVARQNNNIEPNVN